MNVSYPPKQMCYVVYDTKDHDLPVLVADKAADVAAYLGLSKRYIREAAASGALSRHRYRIERIFIDE